MYKYWTPIRVKITVLPYLPYWGGAGGNLEFQYRPMYTCNDLDLPMDQTDFSQYMAAKGVKTFRAHEAIKPFTVEYCNLDRLALQK